MSGDLLAGLAPSVSHAGGAGPVPLFPTPALAALALAAAHHHALGYPHRTYPGDAWLARYAETKGASDAAQWREALHKLPRDMRAAIAADLLEDAK